MSAKHTPGEWFVTRTAYGPHWSIGAGGRSIGRVGVEANARRIVACVNACAGQSTEDLEVGFAAGMEPMPKEDARHISACFEACKSIPTEALEAGVVGEMVEALTAFLDPTLEKSPKRLYILRSKGRTVIAKAKGESP